MHASRGPGDDSEECFRRWFWHMVLKATGNCQFPARYCLSWIVHMLASATAVVVRDGT
jgi:hypothetical protein